MSREVTITVGDETADLLEAAIRGGKWMLCLSYRNEGGTLQHHYETHDYESGDIVPSLFEYYKMIQDDGQLPKKDLPTPLIVPTVNEVRAVESAGDWK